MIDDSIAVSPEERSKLSHNEIINLIPYSCPFISEFKYRSNCCMEEICMFWDGKADESLPKRKCVLVRAAYAISTYKR